MVAEDRGQANIQIIKEELRGYSDAERQIDPEHKLSEIKILTAGMLAGDAFHAHGGETRGVIQSVSKVAVAGG